MLGGAPTDRTAVRPRVGMMLQESGFAGDLTVEETVNLIGRLSGRTDDTARLLERVDLVRKRDVHVAQLSGGERRRLDFATAVYGGPELVFLDEPTNALDPTARDALWEVVNELQRVGRRFCSPRTTSKKQKSTPTASASCIKVDSRTRAALSDLVAAIPRTHHLRDLPDQRRHAHRSHPHPGRTGRDRNQRAAT